MHACLQLKTAFYYMFRLLNSDFNKHIHSWSQLSRNAANPRSESRSCQRSLLQEETNAGWGGQSRHFPHTSSFMTVGAERRILILLSERAFCSAAAAANTNQVSGFGDEAGEGGWCDGWASHSLGVSSCSYACFSTLSPFWVLCKHLETSKCFSGRD